MIREGILTLTLLPVVTVLAFPTPSTSLSSSSAPKRTSVRSSKSNLSFINNSIKSSDIFNGNGINNNDNDDDDIPKNCCTNYHQQQHEQHFLHRRGFLSNGLSVMMTAVSVGGIVAVAPTVASAAVAVAAKGSTLDSRKNSGGLAQRIRSTIFIMDELQRDLMTERYDLLSPYINQLKSYIPLLTTYTDAAFPSTISQDKNGELKNEVTALVKSLDRLKRDIKLFETNPSLSVIDEAYTAYAAMSYHLDRYLRIAGLYTYYEGLIDDNNMDEGGKYYYMKTASSLRLYSGNNSNPKKDPVEVCDLIVLFKGPDIGRTGIVIGFQPKKEKKQIVLNCVVKLDEYKGIREIRSVPRLWVARRTGDQKTDAVFSIPRM